MRLTEPEIQALIQISREAGEKILEVYELENFDSITDFKADDSPLTLADKSSNDIIEAGLKAHFPDIPILSEEGGDISYETRAEWKKFWLVDPLDGTKEFIKRNGEFTVNIALIEDGKAVAGFIYVPVKDWMFWTSEEGEAYFKEGENEIQPLKASPYSQDQKGLKMVVSRSHTSTMLQEFMDKYSEPQTVSMGSSLKFMLIALGKADCYPRLAPTMEWDTGAAQAILCNAGGSVLEFTTGSPLMYNKENLRNPHFVAWGNPKD